MATRRCFVCDGELTEGPNGMLRCVAADTTPVPAAPGRTIQLALPPEFVALCERDATTPETVLRGFIADLCELVSYAVHPRADGYCTNGSDERLYARQYYERVGYRWMARMRRGERA